MTAKELSIIVVSYNTADLTCQCLTSIFRHLSGKLEFEVICLDNHSTDDSVQQIMSRFPQVRLVQNFENAGFARANNQGLKLAGGKSILLFNSDAYMIDDSLLRMLEFLRSDEWIAIAGGGAVRPDGSLQITYGWFPTFIYNNFYARSWYKAFRERFPVKEPIRVGWVSGVYFLAKKAVLDKIGAFDERFRMYYEEVDLCRRARQAGYRIYYFPGSKIVHQQDGFISETKKELRKKSRRMFYEKHYGQLAARLISLLEVK